MTGSVSSDAELAVADEVARAELFRLRMRHWRTQLAAAAILTLSVAWVFNGYAADGRMWIWAGLTWFIFLAQVALCLWLERVPRDAPVPRRWWHITHVLAVGVGILWSSLAWLLPAHNTTLQLLAAFASAMVVLASSSASNSTGLLLAIVLPAMALIPAALIWHAGIAVAGVVSVVLLVLILQHGLSLQRAMLDAIRLRRRAEMLSERLRLEQQRTQEMAREKVMLEERQRMIRDLHDGLGSTLMSTLMALERGSLPPAEVVDVLRHCVDDLRTVIDSLEPMGHDLVVLLATLRHRLAPRLQATGLDVRWEVQDLPLLPWLGPPQALQVMRIVQEALTNVLKHARASSVRIVTRHAANEDGSGQVVIEIEDDGAGFDTSLRAGTGTRGLANLRSRAQRLGATLGIRSAPGHGTCVSLSLPLQAAAA